MSALLRTFLRAFSRHLQRLLFALTYTALRFGANPHVDTGSATARYPIVLVHRLFGFGSFLCLAYFYGTSNFRHQDVTCNFVVSVPVANSAEVCEEPLLAPVNSSMAVTGVAARP